MRAYAVARIVSQKPAAGMGGATRCDRHAIATSARASCADQRKKNPAPERGMGMDAARRGGAGDYCE
jgi:hypothetical protein